jgi:hypothetical protein
VCRAAFARRMDESAANGDLPQATERALLDCEMEENDLYTTAVASTPGNTQAIALVRAAVAAHRTLIPDTGLSPNRCPIATSVANTREEATNGAVICCMAGCMKNSYRATIEVEML